MKWKKYLLGQGTESFEAPTRAQLQKDARCYVYVHQDFGGRVFYVGKGTRDRAWSGDRDAVWNRYVQTRIKGQYEVRIIAHGLTEEEALQCEEQLMAELSDQVVNRQNMGRAIDIHVHNQFTAINQQRDDEYAKGTACTDPAEKIRRFRHAMELHLAASRMCSETGIFGELIRELPPIGHMGLLDSLVRAYIDLNDAQGAAAALDEYIASFPGHAENKQYLAIRKKVDRLRAGKKVRGSPQVAEFSPPDVLPLDWERVPENGVLTIRLKRNLRLQKGDYLDTVGPHKQLRQQGRYGDALVLMKGAIIDAEAESKRKPWPPPPFYYMEAAKACRDLGDFLQECLFLHRYLALSGNKEPAFIKRLGVAAAKLESSLPS